MSLFCIVIYVLPLYIIPCSMHKVFFSQTSWCIVLVQSFPHAALRNCSCEIRFVLMYFWDILSSTQRSIRSQSQPPSSTPGLWSLVPNTSGPHSKTPRWTSALGTTFWRAWSRKASRSNSWRSVWSWRWKISSQLQLWRHTQRNFHKVAFAALLS